MRRTKEDAEETRVSLLKAAELVFGIKGYAATRLSDIADEAHVTRGAIYHHFGNKMELFVALNKERVDPFFKVIDEILQSDLLPRDKIKRIFTDVIQHALKDITFILKQRFEFLRDFESIGCEGLHEFMKERGKAYRALIVDLIKQGQETGNIRQDLIPEFAAFNLEIYLKGMVLAIVMDKDVAFIKDHSDEIIETALNGF